MRGLKWNKRLQLAAFDVRDSSGKRHREVKPFDSVENARKAFVKYRDGLKAPVAIPADVRTFGQYVEKYWPMMRGKAKETTFKEDGMSVRKHLVPYFKDDPLDTNWELRAEEYAAHALAQGVSPGTLNFTLRMLRKILHNARKRKMVTDVPPMPFAREALLRNELTEDERAAYLAAFGDEAAFMAYLAQNRVYGPTKDSEGYEEARRFGASLKPGSDAAKHYFSRFNDAKAWFVVALHTGLRRGDVTNLRWSSVNLKEGFIRVIVEKTNREALIPISATLRAVLMERRARPVVSEYVLVTPEGHRYTDGAINRYHRIALAMAAVKHRVRIHDLRHTFGSTLASAGASELQLQNFFGHSSTAMVKRYSRPSAASMALVVAAFDGTAAGPNGHHSGHQALSGVEHILDAPDTPSAQTSLASGTCV